MNIISRTLKRLKCVFLHFGHDWEESNYPTVKRCKKCELMYFNCHGGDMYFFDVENKFGGEAMKIDLTEDELRLLKLSLSSSEKILKIFDDTDTKVEAKKINKLLKRLGKL